LLERDYSGVCFGLYSSVDSGFCSSVYSSFYSGFYSGFYSCFYSSVKSSVYSSVYSGVYGSFYSSAYISANDSAYSGFYSSIYSGVYRRVQGSASLRVPRRQEIPGNKESLSGSGRTDPVRAGPGQAYRTQPASEVEGRDSAREAGVAGASNDTGLEKVTTCPQFLMYPIWNLDQNGLVAPRGAAG
jgi:hypothetical protein